MEHITDVQERAVARLIEQYRGKVTYAQVVRLMTAEHQVLEDELLNLYSQTLDNTTGPDLDVWGRLVAQKRIGAQDDDTYRVWIKARLMILRSGGEGDMLLRLLQMILPVNPVHLIEEYPAGIRIQVAGDGPPMILGSNGMLLPAMMPIDLSGAGPAPAQDHRLLPALLRSAKAAGVRLVIEYFTTDPADIFHLDTGPGLDVGFLADTAQAV